MPTELPEGLTLGAISAREVPYDALVSPVYKNTGQIATRRSCWYQ